MCVHAMVFFSHNIIAKLHALVVQMNFKYKRWGIMMIQSAHRRKLLLHDVQPTLTVYIHMPKIKVEIRFESHRLVQSSVSLSAMLVRIKRQLYTETTFMACALLS